MKAIVIIDPFSTGAILSYKIIQKGMETIHVYHDKKEKMKRFIHMIPKDISIKSNVHNIYHDGMIENTIIKIKNAEKKLNAKIIAIIPGAETGVRLADALTNIFCLSNGNKINESDARRNKYNMGETLRNAKIHTMKQKMAKTWQEAETFIKKLNPIPFKIVLKPLESAGSDNVFLCTSMEEAEIKFHDIVGKINTLGVLNEAVLIQEYVEGKEYVIDTVSKNKKHKVVAVWEYDKKFVNGSAFVYFAVTIIEITSEIRQIINYHYQVLDALGIQNGPAHGEIKYRNGIPILVEVGARCHGGEGTWISIADRCIGYNQIDVTIDSLLDGKLFNSIPDYPEILLEHGCDTVLVSYMTGKIKRIPGLQEIKKFPSFVTDKMLLKEEDLLQRTIDMATSPGNIILIHKEKEVIEKNIGRIRQLEIDGLYEIY